MARATAVIAAAGSGVRLGAGGPKALVELAGRSLIEWSLDACVAAEEVAAAVVAAPPAMVGDFEAALGSCPLPLQVVAGGETRSGSVAAALASVESEISVVHDAARPLATAALFDAVVRELGAAPERDCVLAATPVTDTVKEVDGHEVVRTLDRSRLWAAQTPQAFRSEPLRAAHAAPPRGRVTDDAMLVEHAGGVVLVEPGPPSNLKVTTPDDLHLAELLLSARDG